MTSNYVSEVNQICLKYSHDHRRSTNMEIIKYNLLKVKSEGCFLCSSEKNKFKQNEQWVCPNFLIYIPVVISISNRILIFAIMSGAYQEKMNYLGSTTSNLYFLPNELIMHIFSFCSYIKKSHHIENVSQCLINHTKRCRPCAKRFLDILTTKTCPNHIITRHCTRDDSTNIENFSLPKYH